MHLVLDLQSCQSESRFRGIGRYSMSLAKAMAAQPRDHEITILLNEAMGEAIEDLRSQFAGLLPKSRIKTWAAAAPSGYLHPENRFRQRASEVLRLKALQGLAPDLVHVTGLFDGWADNAIASIPAHTSYSTSATLYDLIPLVMPETYLYSHPVFRDWYMAKIAYLRRSEVLLGISDCACTEARELLGVSEDRVVNISGAADEIFRPLEDVESVRLETMSRFGLRKPFVMYTGGFDPRKNIAALIRAYAFLPGDLRAGHQLLIVGKAPAPEYQELLSQMTAVGLQDSDVIFAGYVADSDLIRLYNLCALYVFPSLYEGFGLPALEAMSCGAAVIGSDCSSLPEVIGRADALFDPRDDYSIAKKMAQALSDQSFRASLLEHARDQPAKFSWEKSARRALDAFEAVHERSNAVAVALKRPRKTNTGKVAFVPAPNSSVPVEEFGKVQIYADPDCSGAPQSGCRPLERLRLERDRFARVVVELADDAYCAKTLALAAEGNADLLLSHRNIGNVLAALAGQPATRPLLTEMLYRSNGYPAVRSAINGGFSAEMLNRLITIQGLAALGGCQVLSDGIEDASPDIRWRDRVGEVAIDMGELEGTGEASERDWEEIAEAIARNLLRHGAPEHWLVDISNLCVRDAGTGIQRVVRHILDELIANAPQDSRVEPVYLDDAGILRYARGYCARRYFQQVKLPQDEPVEFAEGDVYLGLDLVAHKIPTFLNLFRDLRNRGIRLYFVVYDVLPILRPDCFDAPMVAAFRAWSEAVAEVADGIICISRSVADEFEQWLQQSRPVRKRPLGIGYFHLGADFGADEQPSLEDQACLPEELEYRPTMLMVGTVEPRKGHAQALQAFEQLWADELEVNLLIIGRPGWLSDAIIQRLRMHPERGERLHWIEDAGDSLLRSAYRRASALLMASEGEGFGLPLIEAAHYRVPLIARDLPVFREIAGEHAFYFSGTEAADLADALKKWLWLHSTGQAPQSDGIECLTWRESATQLVEVARNERWVHAWQAGTIRRHPAYDHRLLTQVGRLVRGRLQTTAQSGWLLYGPYLPLQAGRYRVRLLGGWNLARGSAWADMAVGAEAMPVIRKSLIPAVSRDPMVLIEFDVTLPVDVSDYQVRVFVDEQTSLWIEEVVIEPLRSATSAATGLGRGGAGANFARGKAEAGLAAETNFTRGNHA